MGVCQYYNFRSYIESADELVVKINRIDQVIEALELQMLSAAGMADVESYTLDDGQSVIKNTYRSPESIAQAITAFEVVKQRYVSRLTGGGVHQLVDKNSTAGYNPYIS
jgi:hypothetical protein